MTGAVAMTGAAWGKTFLRFSMERALWLLHEGAQTGARDRDAAPDAMDLAAQIFGFDPLQPGVEYLAGIHHPALQTRAQRWGDSMRDAFSAFEAGVRRRSNGQVAVDLNYGEARFDSDAVTFGSPNSNAMARSLYGVEVDAQDRFVGSDAARSGVTFVHPSDAVIRRHSGYVESHRALRLSSGETFVPQHHDGALQDDYLLISSLDHPRERIERAAAQDAEIAALDRLAADGVLDEEAFLRLEALKRRRSRIAIHRILCISGLYGPATGAAKLLLEDVVRLRTFKDAVSGLRSFHAVFHVPRIALRTVGGVTREVPAELGPAPVAVIPVP